MLLVRCVGQSIGMLPLILWTRSPILASPDLSTRWRLAAQAVIGGLLLLSIFEAVQRLPIGDCTAIFFSTPTVTLILSTFLLKDHCGLYRYFIWIRIKFFLDIVTHVQGVSRSLFDLWSGDHISTSSIVPWSESSYQQQHWWYWW